jgi:hypothetical protein
MSTIDAIKEGFRLIHRNWQLIILQFLVSVLCFLGFLVIVGIPLVAAFVITGIDLASIGGLEDILDRAEDPLALINNFLGIIAVAAVSLIVYLLLAISIFIFALGGSAGIIALSLKDPGQRYRTGLFFSEGKRWFMSLMGLTALIGLIYIGAFILIAAGGGLTALSWEALGAGGGWLGIFLRVLITLSLSAALVIITFGSVVVTVGGIVVMVTEGTGATKALRGTFRYIDRRPGIVWLLFVLLLGFITVQVLYALTGYPLQLIPVVGMFVALPYQLLAYVLQGYLGLVILASAFAHYSLATAGSSIREANTSHEAVSV